MSTTRVGIRRHRLLVVLLAGLMAATLAHAEPAQAACGDIAFSRVYNGTSVGGYRMGGPKPKQNVGCYDGNVRESSTSTSHRGQWLSDASVWTWSSVGSKSISAGTHSPAIALIGGPISIGRQLRVGTLTLGGTGIWWF